MTDSSVSIGPQEIGAVSQSEDDKPDEFLGHLVFSTTGEAEVPRQWLLEQWDNYNLPQSILPKEPSRWSAYRRAMRNLIDVENRDFEHYNNEYGYTHQCKFRLEKDQAKGSNNFLLYVDTFWPEELIGEEGGNWQETKVMRFDFHSPEDGPGGLMTYEELGKEDAFYEEAYDMGGYARKLFKRYQSYHVEADLQKILQQMRNLRANAVAIRRSVYFFGAHHHNMVEGVAAVWEEMNQFKETGEDMRVDYTPVVNLESQRELIENRVRDELEGTVDDIVVQTLQEWEDDAEETADEMARQLKNDLGNVGADETASEYNQILGIKLSIKDILKDKMNEFSDKQQDVVERVLEQKELGDM